jgi:hypothetical protein
VCVCVCVCVSGIYLGSIAASSESSYRSLASIDRGDAHARRGVVLKSGSTEERRPSLPREDRHSQTAQPGAHPGMVTSVIRPC